MRARLALLAVAGVLGCGGGGSLGGDGAVDARDARMDKGSDVGADLRPDQSGDVPADTGAADVPADTGVADVPTDTGAADVPTDTGTPVDSGGSCVTQTILGPRGGTTSSCSFKISASIPRDQVNVLIGGGRLCQQGSNNCSPKGGWFWFGDEIALCDATCLVWENSRNNLVVEVGCASQYCSACNQGGGACGNGIDQCCAGWRCNGTTCATCGRGGQTCTTTADCCSCSTCTSGICVSDMGGTCVSQAGCSRGVCRDGFCQCPADQLWCNSGCVNYLDPNNCRGCGNVCATGTGRVCTVDGCVCDPQSAFPDECSGTCVNKKTDRTNCGACFNTCGRLDQVCNNGLCGCPAGQMDCNGGCTDLNNQNHCGMCNRGCPVGTEVCSAGTCVCAPGYTRCPTGNCVNLKTDKFNCNACGTSCPGNKTCNNGTCG